MKNVFYGLVLILGLTSCMNTYTIQGTSNISTLDGRKLYLTVLKDNDFKKVDSCDVVHGEFNFSGKLDSAVMANIFMDDESVLPLVLEAGEIIIKLDDTQQTAAGTPLNEKLFKFFNKYNQLKNQQLELVHRHDQAIMDGKNMDVVSSKLMVEADKISQQEDHLVTSFVCDNFDNVLGPGVFFMVTVGYPYPELTPWIEDIMSKATTRFKNDAYVKDYYKKAQENQQIMNGLREVPATQSNGAGQSMTVPTPNELAKPSKE